MCDAVQAYGKIAVTGADMIAISAHKFHGPKGVGALWIREGLEIAEVQTGGGQEHGLRSGTLSPALIAGLGAAAKVAGERVAQDAEHVARLWRRARDMFGDWELNGSAEARWHGNLSLRREGLDVARLMSDARNVCFSAGSACASGSGRTSHVLRAIGLVGRTGEELDPARLRTLHLAGRTRTRRARHSRRREGAGAMTVTVRFIAHDGKTVEASAEPGASLLEAGQAAGLPLEGTCEGQMACSTCHVVVEPELVRSPARSER